MNSFLPSSVLPSNLPKIGSKSESDVLLNIQGAPKPEVDKAAASFKHALDVEASQQAKSKRREQASEAAEPAKTKRNDTKKEPSVDHSERDLKKVDRPEKSDTAKKQVDDSSKAQADNAKEAQSDNAKEAQSDNVKEAQADNSKEAHVDKSLSESDDVDLSNDITKIDEGASIENESEYALASTSETTQFVLGLKSTSSENAVASAVISENLTEAGESVLAEETLLLDAESEALPLNNGVAVASIADPLNRVTLSDPSLASETEANLGLNAKTRFLATDKIATNQSAAQLNAGTLEELNLEDASVSDFDESIEALKINADKRAGVSGAGTGPATTNSLQGLNMGLNERAMTLTNERIARQSTQQWKSELIEGAKSSIESAAKTSALNPASHFSQQLNAAAETRVQMPVVIRFGQPGWAGMVAERSAMMAAQNIKFAELQLDPPELGPLQVKVTVNQEHAQVSFVAANASVRDALDQTMPKLREMLEEQGLDLLDVDVSDQESQESEASDSENEGQSSGMLASEDEQLREEGGEQHTVVAEYGVDSYA